MMNPFTFTCSSFHRYILLFLLMLNSGFSLAQKFNGIECGKPLNETITAFVAKGFVKKKFDPESPNLTSFVGSINGVKHEVGVVATPQTKIVWKFIIWLPETSSWSSSKSMYFRYREIFTKKYGEPNSDHSFFSTPYEEGDGNEMLALHDKKCTYSSFFDLEDGNGLIVKLVSYNYGEAQVVLHYENKIASLIDDKEKSLIEQNTY